MTIADSWVVGQQGEPVCLHWSDWRLEAIGCDPRILRFDESSLAHALEALCRRRSLEVSVRVEDLQLVARPVVLERALHSNNLRQGLDTVVALVDGRQQ